MKRSGFPAICGPVAEIIRRKTIEITSIDIPENESKRDQIDEGVNLQNPKEKQPEMLEHLQKEIPEQADIGAEIGNVQSKRKM